MKIFLMVATIAALMTGVAFAEDTANVNPFVPFVSFVSDTSYNNNTEVVVTEFGAIVGNRNLELSLFPTYNWDTTKITDIEIAARYTINVRDNISVTPYGELHYDHNWDRDTEIFGVKTRINF